MLQSIQLRKVYTLDEFNLIHRTTIKLVRKILPLVAGQCNPSKATAI